MSFRSKAVLVSYGALSVALWIHWSRPIVTTDRMVAARERHGTASTNEPVQVASASPQRLTSEPAANAPARELVEPGLQVEFPEPIDQFAEWASQYLLADETAKAGLLETGLALARARSTALRDLIEVDPEKALGAALPWEIRRQLPSNLEPFLERPVNAVANYAVMIADDLENQRREVRREASIAGQTFRAFTFGSLESAGSAGGIPVNGIALGDVVALSPGPVRLLSPAEAQFAKTTLVAADPKCDVSGESTSLSVDEQVVEIAGEIQFVCRSEHASLLNTEWTDASGKWLKSGKEGIEDGPGALDSWSQGPKTVLFIRVNFPDDLTEPISLSDAYTLMNDVNTWIVANSYGSSAMITTVTPLLTLPNTKAFYSQIGDGQLLTDARAVAKQAGYDTADFQLDAVRFTSVPGYSYGGKAYVRGKGCWLQSSSVGVACHEFGHNYGLWHANYWTSSQASGIGPGTHNEYGDIFDTMGSAGAGDKHFNANHRNKIDWLGDKYIQSATGGGTFRLHALDVDQLTPGRFYGLKLTKDFDREYWVELRQRFASNKHIQNGVLLRWDPWAESASGAHLLDTTPGSPSGNSSKDDAALVVGRTFADEGAGIFITPVAIQGSGPDKTVDVVVKTGSYAGNQPPAVSVQASAPSVGTGQPVEFTAVAADADGDPLAYEWDFGDLTFGANSPVVTNTWSTAGEYLVRCRVSDMKGGLASSQLVVRVGNPSTYRVSGRITDLLGTPIEGVRVHNGATSTSAYRGSFTDSDGNFTITRLTAGTHTISATLYGYTFSPLGTWSNPVTVGPELSGIDFLATALPVVGWELVDSAIGEAGVDSATLRLSRTGPTTSALLVKYKRAGTAAYSSDYTITPSPGGSSPYSLAIPAGASAIDVIVTPVQDTSAEGTETIYLALAEDATYRIGWQAEARLEIVDDENPGKPSIYVSSGADDRATETGSDTAAFSINRTGDRSGSLTVNYTLGGTATPNLDYTPPSGTAVIPAGESAVTVTFAALDDNRVEGDESVAVSLVTAPAYTISGGSTTLIIQDDDPPLVKLSVTDALAVEGGSATARVTVQRVGGLASPLTVNYSPGGTATPGSDFTALPGTISIPAGAASAQITITAINDTLTEGDETVAITLQSSVDYNVGLPSSGVVVIQDNEIPTVTIATTDATATEGGGDSGEFSISRGTATTGNLTVQLAISGQATAEVDYASLPPSVVIPAGSTNVLLQVAPIDDSIREMDEKVTLLLLNSPAYNTGTAAPVSVTIKDNDGGGSFAVGFESAASTILESQTSVRLPVVLSAASSAAVTVDYAVVGGSAQPGSDFTLAAGTLTFAANKTLATINFSLSNDSAQEGHETILVALSTPSGAQLDATTTHTVNIVDDDASVVTLTATDSSAAEAGGTGNFRVTRTGDTSAPVTVTLQVTGTASSPTDYASLPELIVIPAGNGQVDLTVTPVNDQTDEMDETVILRITSVAGGRIGSPNTATVTIADDDDAVPLPEVSLTAIDDLTTEGVVDVARVEFRRSGDASSGLVVQFGTSGSATLGGDLPALPGSITIASGQTSAFLELQAIADGNPEALESLTLILAPTAAYSIGPTNSATIRIADSPFMTWQLAHFSPAQFANPMIAGPGADPDADGLNNFTEYAFNRDPSASDVVPLLTQSLEPIGQSGDRLLVVTYARRVIRLDVAYTLGVGGELGIWDTAPALFDETDVTLDPGGVTETVRTQVLAPLSHFDHRFVRLQVSRP